MNNFFKRTKKAKKAAKKKQNLQLEALENRVLLSADLGISMADLEQQSESLTTEIIESEQHLADFDSGEFEPHTIAVDDTLTRLMGQMQADEEIAIDAIEAATAPDVAPPAEQAEASKIEPSATVQLGAAELYTLQRIQAAQVIILDASIPQLAAVINELVEQYSQDPTASIHSLESLTQSSLSAEAPTARIDATETSLELIGLSIEQQLLANADRQIKIFVLDNQQDGLMQVTGILDYFKNVTAVHLLSHGAAGARFLGNSKLNTQQLRQNQLQLKRWGEALNDDGDILLYGCDVAKGEVGLEFVQTMAEITGADVAASNDETGNVAGADWDLEETVGEVESASLISSTLLTALSAVDTYQPNGLFNGTNNVEKAIKTLDLSLIVGELTIVIAKGNSISITKDGVTQVINHQGIENLNLKGSKAYTLVFEKGASLAGELSANSYTSTKLIVEYKGAAVQVDLGATLLKMP